MTRAHDSARTRERSRAQVFHRDDGSIEAIVMADSQGAGPAASILPPEGCRCVEIELPPELAGMDILAIHESYDVDTSQKVPRLIRRKQRR